jgi:hypothetical protein
MGRNGRLVSRIGAAVAAASGLWLFVTSEATAATNPSSVESAWWNMAAPAPLAIPSPTTSSDQLQVGEGANGPLSYAAVRFQLPANIDPGSASVVLRLDLVQTGTVGTPVVAACVTTGSWTPGGDQAASSAPGYSCGEGKESVGVVSGSSETWSLNSAFMSSSSQGLYDIALVPDPGTSAPFSVDYSQPTTSSVLITGSPAQTGAPSSDSGLANQPAYSGAPAGPPVGMYQPNSEIPTGVAAVAAGSSPVAAGGEPPPALAAGATRPTTSPAAPGNLSAGAHPGTAAVAASAEGTPARRVMAAVVLIALGAALYLISRTPARAPRLIGAFASVSAPAPPVRVGGIGRFARPRTGPPPRLS